MLDEQTWSDSEGEGEGEGGRDDTMSDAHLEKVLLENMSDDDDNSTERDKERGKGAKKSRFVYSCILLGPYIYEPCVHLSFLCTEQNSH